MVYDVRSVAGDAEALAILRANPERVYSQAVIVSEDPVSLRTPATPPASEVSLLEYAATRAAWRVTTTEAGWLVTTDAYYPGWRASVDQHEVRIARANGAFRAVPVPAGEHVLVWDGMDERSRPARPGIYFARIVSNGSPAMRRIVKLP